MRVYAIPQPPTKMSGVDNRSYASILLNGQNSGSILLNAIRFQYHLDPAELPVGSVAIDEWRLPFQLLMRFSAPPSIRHPSVIAYNTMEAALAIISSDKYTQIDYSTLTVPSFMSPFKKGGHIHGLVCYELVRNEIIFESDSFPSILDVEIQLLNSRKEPVGLTDQFLVPIIEIQYEIL